MTKNVPVVLFCFNNVLRLSQTVEALKKNKECINTKLYIIQDYEYSEGWKNVNQYIKRIDGFKEIIIKENKYNKGLRENIISGLTGLFKTNEQLIILEDDIIVSNSFLTNMNKALNIYKSNDEVFSITGFNNPKRIMPIPKEYFLEYYYSTHFHCWGWATWKDKWKLIDWNENNKKYVEDKTWAGQVLDYCKTVGMAHVYPINSMVNNIGNMGGVHGTQRKFDILLHKELNNNIIEYNNNVIINKKLMKNFYLYNSRFRRILSKMKMGSGL